MHANSDIDDPRIKFACSDIDDPRINFVRSDDKMEFLCMRAATLMTRTSILCAANVIKSLRWDLIRARACSDIDDQRIKFARSEWDQIAKMRLDSRDQIVDLRIEFERSEIYYC